MYIDIKTYAMIFLHYEIKQPYEMRFEFYNGNFQKTKKLERKIMFNFKNGYYCPAYVISKSTMMFKQPGENITIDFVYNFFIKNIEFSPKGFVADDISLDQLSSTGFLDESTDYKSDFILETDQEKQLLHR